MPHNPNGTQTETTLRMNHYCILFSILSLWLNFFRETISQTTPTILKFDKIPMFSVYPVNGPATDIFIGKPQDVYFPVTTVLIDLICGSNDFGDAQFQLNTDYPIFFWQFASGICTLRLSKNNNLAPEYQIEPVTFFVGDSVNTTTTVTIDSPIDGDILVSGSSISVNLTFVPDLGAVNPPISNVSLKCPGFLPVTKTIVGKQGTLDIPGDYYGSNCSITTLNPYYNSTNQLEVTVTQPCTILAPLNNSVVAFPKKIF